MKIPSIRIEPVTDPLLVPELARLTDLALQNDAFHAFSAQYAPKPVHEETFDRLYAALKDSNSYIFRALMDAVDENGLKREQLVGFTQWFVGYLNVPKVDPFARQQTSNVGGHADVTDVAVAEEAGSGQLPVDTKAAPEVVSPDPFAILAKETGNCHVKAIRGKKHVCVYSHHSFNDSEFLILTDLRRMIVHPDYQRRGIGQKLVEWGVKLADQEKIVGWLWARPAGFKLYERNGWKVVDAVPFNVPGLEIEPLVSMLRIPHTQ
jgi:GNAT superfamily N-acetyltransferase